MKYVRSTKGGSPPRLSNPLSDITCKVILEYIALSKESTNGFTIFYVTRVVLLLERDTYPLNLYYK